MHTPRPISMGLDHFLYGYVCLLASVLYIHVFLPISRFLLCFVPPIGLCLSVLGATCLKWNG